MSSISFSTWGTPSPRDSAMGRRRWLGLRCCRSLRPDFPFPASGCRGLSVRQIRLLNLMH